MRGWSCKFGGNSFVIWVLPAHAGVIPVKHLSQIVSESITRTCGGDPKIEEVKQVVRVYYPHMRGWSCLLILSVIILIKYYPHMRGWSSLCLLLERLFRVLPAHAGVILSSSALSYSSESITRTCGGDPVILKFLNNFYLYYPHMRGWSYCLGNKYCLL